MAVVSDFTDPRIASPLCNIYDDESIEIERKNRQYTFTERISKWIKEKRLLFGITFGPYLLGHTEIVVLDIIAFFIFGLLGYGIFMLFNFLYYFGSTLQSTLVYYLDDTQDI